MGQLQNQFQQMMGGQSPYSGGGQQRGNFGTPGYQQPQTRGSGAYSGMPQVQGVGGAPLPRQMSTPFTKPQQSIAGREPIQGNAPNNEPWKEFEPQKPQRGIDQMPGRGGPPMMPPTKQPPTTVPPGTGGIKPQREPVGPPVPSTTPQNPAQQRIDPSRVQASAAGQMQGGSVSQPVGQMQPTPYQGPFQGYREMPGGRNPYRGHGGGPRRDGGPGSMG